MNDNLEDGAGHYAVRARTSRDGVGVAQTKGTQTEFDRSWGKGASAELPGPAELLAAAFAACLIKNIERFSQLLRFDYRSAEVEVDIHRIDAPPHFDKIHYVLTIVTPESPVRVDLLTRNLEKHGTVYNTLASACDVSGHVHSVLPPTNPPARPVE